MDWRAYVQDLWVSVLKRKLNMVALIFFVATYFGLLPSWWSVVGVATFLVAYSTVYYYNDLVDYEIDRKQVYMPPEKLLYHGKANYMDYIHLLAWVSVLGTAAAFLYSPLLGIVVTLAILLNHARTLVRSIPLREVLLTIVEFLNFEALWIAMYGTLIPGIALPLFVTYSTAYGFVHAAYKLRSESLFWILRQWWMTLLGCATTVAAVFSIPLVTASIYHFLGIILFTLTYVGIVGIRTMYYANRLEVGMKDIGRSHDVAILTTTALLVLMGTGILYARIPTSPLPVSAPAEMTTLLSTVDAYQHTMAELVMRF